MSCGRVVLPSIGGGTVEWSCESTVEIAPDVEEMKAKEMKIQEGFEEFLHLALIASSTG